MIFSFYLVQFEWLCDLELTNIRIQVFRKYSSELLLPIDILVISLFDLTLQLIKINITKQLKL